ncbi:MAG: aminoacetone oxidase family FAD-binding enzyme [Lachnospiraceae bacterium]|jgi:predicted Rossmann fold flavoprotein|nr:aminoacetone oxidase family FAD-binding enzyme [Lachnospiraceae bacterium]
MEQIVIIGGGASGLAAAISAARELKKNLAYAKTDRGFLPITIIEHNDSVGKKIPATGNGRCNLSNVCMLPECFHTKQTSFVETVLSKFSFRETIMFFESMGLLTKSRLEYLYPRSSQASSVREVLEKTCRDLGVRVQTNSHVKSIKKSKTGANSHFVIEISPEKKIESKRVLLANGGKAGPNFGCDGSGYAFAKTFGHIINPTLPALVQVSLLNNPLKQANGIRVDATVSAITGNGIQKNAKDTGELQITDYGISGIPVFQISRHISASLFAAGNPKVQIDFLPDLTREEATNYFMKMIRRQAGNPGFTAFDLMLGLFPKRLILPLLTLSGILIKTPVSDLTGADVEALVGVCKKSLFGVSDTKGFENAQTTLGGVELSQISPKTMESLLEKGLYFSGEIMDVDGKCGGYNLQWAWSTGYLAGKAMALDVLQNTNQA